MTYRIINEALKWYSNLTKEEKEGIKNKYEEYIYKPIIELTIEDMVNIYVDFMGVLKK